MRTINDGVGTDLTAFISDQMRADWAANRTELLAFWRSGKSEVEGFPDDMALWLLTQGRPDRLPSAALHLD